MNRSYGSFVQPSVNSFYSHSDETHQLEMYKYKEVWIRQYLARILDEWQ